jgi:phosphomannomutase/phosphoglucomutase
MSTVSETTLPKEIFKAYDIRGIVGKTLNAEIAEQIGHAIGSEAAARKQKTVAIGRDGRLSGPELVAALARGIAAAGIDVIDIGMVPTPVLYYATHKLGTNSGVAVTGSHNPPDYNGFKIVLGGETLSGDDIQALRQRLVDGNLTNGEGTIRQEDVRDAYIERIVSDVKLARPMKVALDCGNGVASEMGPRLLRALDCELTELYCEIDGHFPNHHPDPSQPKNLQDLIAEVKRGGYDVGLAFDGDGDRLGVVTPDGDIIWPDRQLILFARSVLAANPGAEIIYDVKCTRTLPKEIEAAGGRAIMWKTGHSFIKKKIKETGALLAGEMSGHIFFKDRWYGFDDGLYAAARLLELLSADPRSPADVFASLPNTVNTPELQIKFAEGEHFKTIDKLVKAADFPDAKVTTIDGIRADFEDGFGLIRASNTTPVLVLRFEGDTKEALHRIEQRFAALIRQVAPDVELPF